MTADEKEIVIGHTLVSILNDAIAAIMENATIGDRLRGASAQFTVRENPAYRGSLRRMTEAALQDCARLPDVGAPPPEVRFTFSETENRDGSQDVTIRIAFALTLR